MKNWQNKFGQNMGVAKPCSVSWESMIGNNKVRFCGKCEKHVYNIAAMTQEETQGVIADNGGKPCVRLYKRADGTVKTSDCPKRTRTENILNLWYMCTRMFSGGQGDSLIQGEVAFSVPLVVCAAQTIEAGALITREQIDFRPVHNIPEDGLGSISLVLGATAKFSIPAGTVINSYLISKLSIKQIFLNHWNGIFHRDFGVS